MLTEGWAFDEITGGTGYAGRLVGRTAELIATMDTPGPIYRFSMRAPGKNALERATLGFCGIDVVRHTRFGTVRGSDPAKRSRWIVQSRDLGMRLRHGARTRVQRIGRRLSPWLTAMRLQIYPMTFIAYWVGSFLATRTGEMDVFVFITGYCILFALEAATVFLNDIYDFESDTRNRFYSLFSGGSRVLVDGRLSVNDLHRGARIALATAFVFALLLLIGSGAPWAASLCILVTITFLAIFYTVPPIKFSHRGLGEIDVALTHSFAVLFCGYIFQNGSLSDPTPWLVSLLLFLAVLPAITLSGIPDAEADRVADKRTLAVRFSIRSTMLFSAFVAATAAVLAAMMNWVGIATSVLSWLGVVALLHAGWLVWLILRRRSETKKSPRIDHLMAASLTFVIWFGIVPLINLLGAR